MSICSRNPGPQALQPQVADDEIEFQRLGHVRDDPDSDDNKSEKEAGAKEANSAKQEPCRNCFSWVFIARYCKVKHAHVNLQTNNNIEHLQEYTKNGIVQQQSSCPIFQAYGVVPAFRDCP